MDTPRNESGTYNIILNIKESGSFLDKLMKFKVIVDPFQEEYAASDNTTLELNVHSID